MDHPADLRNENFSDIGTTMADRTQQSWITENYNPCFSDVQRGPLCYRRTTYGVTGITNCYRDKKEILILYSNFNHVIDKKRKLNHLPVYQ